jgi:hypothetical protein
MKRLLFILAILLPILSLSAQEGTDGNLNGTGSISGEAIHDSLVEALANAEVGLSLGDSDRYTTQYDYDVLIAMLQQLGDFDLTAPHLDSISIGGLSDSTFICFFDTTDLHQDSIPSVGSFTITQDGYVYGVNAVDIHNDSLLVTMDSIAHHDSVYLFTYTQSLYPRLQDGSHNKVATFSNHVVTNYVSAPPPILVLEDYITDDHTISYWSYTNTANMTLEASLITAWADTIGSNNLTSDAAYRPLLIAGGVDFNGGQGFYDIPFTYAQPEFIYIIFRMNTWTDGDYIFDGYTGDGGLLYQKASANNLRAYAGSASSEATSLSLDTWYIARVYFNGASSKLIINDGTPITGNFGASAMNGISIGCRGGGGSNSDITIKAILLRNSDEDESEIYNALKSRFGI